MKYNKNTVHLDAENVRSAYISIVDNGPIKVLFGLLNNEHYAAAKDIASILEDQMSLGNFMSRITPVVIEASEENSDPTALIKTLSNQVQALTEVVGRLVAPESKEGTNE